MIHGSYIYSRYSQSVLFAARAVKFGSRSARGRISRIIIQLCLSQFCQINRENFRNFSFLSVRISNEFHRGVRSLEQTHSKNITTTVVTNKREINSWQMFVIRRIIQVSPYVHLVVFVPIVHLRSFLFLSLIKVNSWGLCIHPQAALKGSFNFLRLEKDADDFCFEFVYCAGGVETHQNNLKRIENLESQFKAKILIFSTQGLFINYVML